MSFGTDNLDYRYLLKLCGVTVILQTLGWTISTFPFFQFFAFIPAIVVCLYLFHHQKKFSHELFVVVFVSFLIPALFKFLVFGPSLRELMASLSPAVILLVWFYSGIRLGSLKSSYLIIFWLGIEYVFTAIQPPVFNHLPGAAFRMWGEFLIWIKFTGFQGTTLWLLLTNVIFTNSFFERTGSLKKKINRSPYLAGVAVGLLPMIISMLLYNGNPESDLTEFFSHPREYYVNFNYNPFYSYYLDYGEYLGKTCFWLSIFIILSLIVKGFLSRNGN